MQVKDANEVTRMTNLEDMANSAHLLNTIPHLMRPPGGGIPTYSAGKGAEVQLQSMLYKKLFPSEFKGSPKLVEAGQIQHFWKETWKWLPSAQIVLIGVPLDTGAGIRRGAAYGPRGIREQLFQFKKFQKWVRERSVIDLGDLFVNPHLLHDSMLNEEQKALCRQEMYPDVDPSLQKVLPVSALSQLKLVLEVLLSSYPQLRFQIMGGDHSIAWPVAEVLAKRFPETLGIIQSDAHTDLLSSRLGVKYCFGTWSYHANQLLKGNEKGKEQEQGRFVQVGIRQSGKTKEHWEKTTGIRQYWASEILSRPRKEVIEEIVEYFHARGVKHLYFSNDIDGTDEKEAPATGTPAAQGLSSRFLLKLMDELAKSFEIVAGDVSEVAPDLGWSKQNSKKTCLLGASYIQACLESQLSKKSV